MGDIEIGDMDDLEDDLAELDVSASCMPGPAKPPNMITDSKPIDIQTAVVGAGLYMVTRFSSLPVPDQPTRKRQQLQVSPANAGC